MLSLQIPKSPLEIVVETWLECLTVKNSPEKLIYVDQFFFKISWDLSSSGSTSRAPQVLTYFEQSVLSGQHFTISISQISSLTLQKVIRIQVLT